MSSPSSALVVAGLSVSFVSSERTVDAVRNVSFTVGRGETVAVVGESGSGKSVTALSVMRLVEHGGGRILGGSLDFARRDGTRTDLARANGATMRAIRGAEIAMIFQEPMTSLNPVYTVGEQIAESIRLHQGKDRAAARREALSMLEQVRIPEAKQLLDRHPHQLSGGMRQRVMIAMALALEPAVVIMDEPTTALDVVTQREILTELAALQRDLSFAVLFITHDLSLLVELADSIAVMYAGRLLEQATAMDLYRAPRHPYTLGLLRSFPPLHGARAPLTGIPGSPPDLRTPPPGCPFHPRCGYAMDVCRTEMPVAFGLGGRSAACWLHDGAHEVPAELAVHEPGTASRPGTAPGHAGIPEPSTLSPAAATETGSGMETRDGTRTGAGAETGDGTRTGAGTEARDAGVTGARTEGGTEPATARMTAAVPAGTTAVAPDTKGKEAQRET